MSGKYVQKPVTVTIYLNQADRDILRTISLERVLKTSFDLANMDAETLAQRQFLREMNADDIGLIEVTARKIWDQTRETIFLEMYREAQRKVIQDKEKESSTND